MNLNYVGFNWGIVLTTGNSSDAELHIFIRGDTVVQIQFNNTECGEVLGLLESWLISTNHPSFKEIYQEGIRLVDNYMKTPF